MPMHKLFYLGTSFISLQGKATCSSACVHKTPHSSPPGRRPGAQTRRGRLPGADRLPGQRCGQAQRTGADSGTPCPPQPPAGSRCDVLQTECLACSVAHRSHTQIGIEAGDIGQQAQVCTCWVHSVTSHVLKAADAAGEQHGGTHCALTPC